MTSYVEEIEHPVTGELIRLEADDEQSMSLLVAQAFERAAAHHEGDWLI